VEKTVIDGRTSTSIRQLNKEERVQEMARMLGGADLTKQTLAYARELVEKKGNHE
jgi:DNA repair protein RecN (Recombination protein N)